MNANQVLTKVGQSANISVINPNVELTSKVIASQSEIKPIEKKEVKPSEPKKEQKKTTPKTAPKTAPKKDAKTTPVKSVKPNNAIFTQKDALKALRDANKETKSLSGVIKTIRTFWKDGYNEAFKFLNMKFEDIEIKKIMVLWSESLKDENGVLLYKSRQARFKMDSEGKKEYIVDKEGKKIYDTVKKQLDNNFTVLRIFDAIVTAKIEKGEIAL